MPQEDGESASSKMGDGASLRGEMASLDRPMKKKTCLKCVRRGCSNYPLCSMGAPLSFRSVTTEIAKGYQRSNSSTLTLPA